MAAKIKEGLRDITEGLVERLKGGPKYADNLLGESLQDQLRKATAKELLGPSELLNGQVVDTINQDIANGKDSKEIVWLLRKRLRTDNPHKQWLAVLLVGRVMHDCAASLGSHQEELLQEVARTMSRPARPDSSTAKITRQAAKDLLRSYGRAGTSAFRAVNRTAGTGEHRAAPATSETASVVAEVQLLIEQAQANTELLSEMLLVGDQASGPGAGATAGGGGNRGGVAGGDEFENELTLELVTEVRELRTLFDAYLEQLQSMTSPEAEAVMMKALEAVDLLDGALALQQDVACNQRELEQQASITAAAAKPADKEKEAPKERDLISLDDLVDELPPQPSEPQPGAAASWAAASASAAQDPFASLDTSLLQQTVASPTGAAAAAAPLVYGSVYGAPAQQPPALPPQPYPYAQQQQPPVLHPAVQQPPPYGSHGAQAPIPYSSAPAQVPSPNNPFAAPPMPSLPYGSGPVAAPQHPAGLPIHNPFATPAPAAPQPAGMVGAAAPAAVTSMPSGGPSATVDAEWAMFFAGRTGPHQLQQQQQYAQQQ